MGRATNVIDRILVARQRYGKTKGGRRSLEESKKLAELAQALVKELEEAKIYSYRLEENPPRIVVDLNKVLKQCRRIEMGIRIVYESSSS